VIEEKSVFGVNCVTLGTMVSWRANGMRLKERMDLA